MGTSLNARKQKKYLWTSLHGTSARLLTRTTQIDLIDILLLSLLNLPGTKSTLLPSVRPCWQARESWLRRVQAILFFWSVHAPDDKCEAGVGYANKISLVGKLAFPPKWVNDHLMTIRLPLHHGKKFATIISTYAPTMTNTDEAKDKFYEDFEYIISTVPAADKLINFNARVGQDSASWEGVLGKHGTWKCNKNGLLVLQTCTKHNLLITNTVFHLPTHNKTSWMHPCSKHWHLIDYVIVRHRDRQDVRVTRAICGAECWTVHCLIISKLSIRVQPKTKPQGKKAPKRLNIMKLKDVLTKQLYVEALDERLDAILLDEQNVKTTWMMSKLMTFIHIGERIPTAGLQGRLHHPYLQTEREPTGMW